MSPPNFRVQSKSSKYPNLEGNIALTGPQQQANREFLENKNVTPDSSLWIFTSEPSQRELLSPKSGLFLHPTFVSQ
ncbi:hypothetical protein TNCT_134331 [Trichonephila clavata]|uniref:Uncharacterized protein n=1 Tax=Trichonephila clavata TaxID=2740835 RepID=A0A8X6LP58_TRICU|nr:hypothetical protein TNCT_134331 [Trichonephila clavata]